MIVERKFTRLTHILYVLELTSEWLIVGPGCGKAGAQPRCLERHPQMGESRSPTDKPTAADEVEDVMNDDRPRCFSLLNMEPHRHRHRHSL